MTQVHHSSGIPMPFLSISQEAARNSRAHTLLFSFWCDHEGSFSKGQREPIFSADVHLAAFDGRRSNSTGPPASKLVIETHTPRGRGCSHRTPDDPGSD